MTTAATRPLGDLRVLDLASGAIGGIGRLLAELGADVVKVEPCGDYPERTEQPAYGGLSLGFVAANLGKRGLTLDLAREEDRAILDALAGEADLLLEATVPGSTEAKLLDVAGLRNRHPTLVVLSVSAFGPGTFQDFVATDAVLQALNGVLARSGLAGRAPLLPPGELAIQCAVVQAAYAALIGCLHRRQTGTGDHLDLSLLDGAAQALDPGHGIAGSASAGVLASQMPRGRPEITNYYPIFTCRDGQVRLCILAARQWRGMFEWLGRPALFSDPRFDSLSVRHATPELNVAIAALVAGKTRAEIEAEGKRFGVPTAPILTLKETLDSPHLRDGGLLRDVELAPGLTAPFSDGVLKIDGKRARTAGILPTGEVNPSELLAEWSRGGTAPVIDGFGAPGRPLKGLRVIDLGTIVVGAEQGRLLADYGAEVIKVECAEFPDGMRANSDGGMSASIAAGHRNKRSLGLNLRSEKGRELLLELAGQSDVVLSNFKPGGMASLGLSAETLLARNPRLIVVESSAYGDEGPWADRMGYGPLVRASAGLTAQWRYEDDPKAFGDTVTVYPDHVAARLATTAVLALLLRRARTGRGGRIALGQIDVILSQMAAMVAKTVLSSRGVLLADAIGRDSPWGVFPSEGDDDWIVISIRGDEDWRNLCTAMACPDLASDPGSANRAGRVAARSRIDTAVAAWTRVRTATEAMASLQRHKVPAAAMARASEMPESPFFRSRTMFQTFVQPQLDIPVTVDNAPVRASRLACPPLAPAPMFGEHSIEIARDLLGLCPDDIASLIAEGVLQTGSSVDRRVEPAAA
ncbi:CaiB/BaiF CoA transferase family protein [Rhizorhabdus dicambivorans]|uniref:CoA transferase n=2 Tax=Rhizorhabdus dicambivorans TaxID=1850238 RepID=A0A2A4FPB5_9SPHN|nr:CoA transferase [Rhizorhabdus dicambivorans]ATE64705.1 CoA transferase [Rhizorhabdus dicambivorans]PCE40007.1 CoA transferase [Rhizorhabdus dicambivorans]